MFWLKWLMILHSSTLWCYNALNKESNMDTPNPSLLRIVRGFFGVTIVAYFSLRLRSQCVNNAMIQPLMTVVVMWTRISNIDITSSLRHVDAWEIGDFIIIPSVYFKKYPLPISWINLKNSLCIKCLKLLKYLITLLCLYHFLYPMSYLFRF